MPGVLVAGPIESKLSPLDVALVGQAGGALGRWWGEQGWPGRDGGSVCSSQASAGIGCSNKSAGCSCPGQNVAGGDSRPPAWVEMGWHGGVLPPQIVYVNGGHNLKGAEESSGSSPPPPIEVKLHLWPRARVQAGTWTLPTLHQPGLCQARYQPSWVGRAQRGLSGSRRWLGAQPCPAGSWVGAAPGKVTPGPKRWRRAGPSWPPASTCRPELLLRPSAPPPRHSLCRAMGRAGGRTGPGCRARRAPPPGARRAAPAAPQSETSLPTGPAPC